MAVNEGRQQKENCSLGLLRPLELAHGTFDPPVMSSADNTATAPANQPDMAASREAEVTANGGGASFLAHDWRADKFLHGCGPFWSATLAGSGSSTCLQVRQDGLWRWNDLRTSNSIISPHPRACIRGVCAYRDAYCTQLKPNYETDLYLRQELAKLMKVSTVWRGYTHDLPC